jgi:hypothetical protein
LLAVTMYIAVGVGFNQLLDVIVLAAIVVGLLAARVRHDGERVLAAVVAVAVAWAAGTGVALSLLEDARDTARGLVSGERTEEFHPDPLGGVVGPNEAVLAEDAYVEHSLGRHPTVLDPFMLLRVARIDPRAAADLVDRIEAGEFAVVAMVLPVEADHGDWWTDYHFGPDVIEALRTHYRLETVAGGYYLYRRAE